MQKGEERSGYGRTELQRDMDVLSGGDGGERPPPPGRRYSKRRSSLSLSASDMFLYRPPQPTYVASSWPGELCVLVSEGQTLNEFCIRGKAGVRGGGGAARVGE